MSVNPYLIPHAPNLAPSSLSVSSALCGGKLVMLETENNIGGTTEELKHSLL